MPLPIENDACQKRPDRFVLFAGPGSGGFSNELIGTLNVDYLWTISPTASFEQTLPVEDGQSNTFVNPVSELKLTVIGNLFVTLDYKIRYNSTALDSTLHTDTITSINFGYSFGKQKTS
ncbi:MAG: DUF481 domain-containing protein [Gammaproteobacteria bacterium]|nr:DUF481 domain-containing protein [Gammaproteobacteria bacterium]